MADIDLAVLARGYRHRPTSAAALLRAEHEAEAARLGPGSLALDVGGGRGDHAARFAATGAATVVVDRSEVMAFAARKRRGVDALVADSEHLPLRPGVADLVYFHVSVHYGRLEAVVGEGIRVLRPGGSIVVWTFSLEHFRSSFLARWFPSIPGIDERRFPDPAKVVEAFRESGLQAVTVEAEVEVVQRSAAAWMAAAAAQFVSTLQMLPPGELEAGLRRFADAFPDPDQIVEYPLDYRRIAGVAPTEIRDRRSRARD